MALAHLSDDEIQSWLDGNTAHSTPVTSHLQSCSHCAERLADYRDLYTALADGRAFVLPQGFAARVAARVAVSTPTGSRSWMVEVALAAFAIAACLAAGLVFVDFPSWLSELRRGVADNSLLAHFGIKSSLLSSTAAVMLAVGLADRLIAAFRRGAASLTI